MNIVYAVTHDYYPKLIPSITSLLEHNPKANIYVLAEDDEIDIPFKVNVINVKDQQFFPESGVNYHNSFTYINLLKVCYPELLKCNKVIHLDVDTIICDSLEPFWKTDVTGKWVAAVPEYKGRYKPFGDTYYNMGVALINLQQMRKDNIVGDMATYLNTVKQPYADQDAWNKYGLEQDKFVPVAVRYNENFACGFTDKPAIVHYCGITQWWNNKAMYRWEYLDKYSR